MVLATFLPAFLAFVALIEVPLFLHLRRSDIVSRDAANLMMILSLALPVIAYVILNAVFPDAGAIEVF